jgi:hypothetical protein
LPQNNTQNLHADTAHMVRTYSGNVL